jgi:RHS repeat-associated protein
MMGETNTIGNSLSQVTRVGSLLLGEVRGGVAQHFDQDAFNSVIVTSLADGTIPGRLSYRAFGAVRTQTGLINSPFRFNGYIDDGNGELSSPARYYASALGRFTGMDPAAMDPMNPMTLNPYLGLNGNPMAMIDPDGRWAQSGHYYNTFYVAARLGYPEALAQKLAFYAQLPDQVDKLDAMGMTSRSILASMSMMSGDQGTRNNAQHRRAQEIIQWQQTVHTVLHVLTGRPGVLETQTIQASIDQAGDDWATVGLLVHPLGDSFAHRKPNGMMYSPLIGHGMDGTAPDRIQRNQKRFSEYTDVLIDTLSKTAKAQGVQLTGGVSADQIRKELRAVMDIDIEVPLVAGDQSTWESNRKTWRPTQWLEPYPNYLMSRERTDDELEALSVAKFKELLAKQGLNNDYKPETLTASLAELLVPMKEQYTLDDAVEKGPFDKKTEVPLFNSSEAKMAIARAIGLYKRNANNRGAPSVVVESNTKAGVEFELGKK